MAGRKVGNVDMRQVKDKVSTLRAGSAALRGNENEAKAAQTWKQAGEVTDMRQKAKLIAGLLS
jgi:hypothetical protein